MHLNLTMITHLNRFGKEKHIQNTPESKIITCHMIFDIKMDMTRKVCFKAGGHLPNGPSSITYSNVDSRDRIQLAFLLASLSNFEKIARDVGNAY